MGKMIVLISSKGGSGKSTVAIGLASAFSSEGKKVLLIDADEGARCLDSMLKADTDTLFDLRDVLSGTCELQDAVLRVAGLDGVSVIPSPLSPEPINMAALGELAELQKNNYDYVIIDLKGQLPAERLVLLPKTAQFISVVTTDKIALRNTGLLNTKLIENGIVPRLILNRFKEKNTDKTINNIDDMIDTCAAQLLGVIPEDHNINSLMGRIVVGKAALSIFKIASRLEGQNTPLTEIKDLIK